VTATGNRYADAYLERLDAAAAVLPRHVRDELRDDIRDHLVRAVEEHGDDEAALRNAVDALGEPADVVRAAAEEHEVVPAPQDDRRLTTGDLVALGLYELGPLAFGIGWLIGLFLFVRSPAWTRGEKAAGLLVPPGGAMAAALFGSLYLDQWSVLFLVLVGLGVLAYLIAVGDRRRRR
jgi:hypothetical protein